MKLLGVHFPSNPCSLLYNYSEGTGEVQPYSLTGVNSLHSFVCEAANISRGVHYLHTQNPPIIHCDLYSTNVFSTTKFTAKINHSVFKNLKNALPYNHSSHIAMNHFMPPEEGKKDEDHYNTPRLSYDLFSFDCVVCHLITQQWPVVDLAAGRSHQCYIDQISDASLRCLASSCLEDDPERCPPISNVYNNVDIY